MFRVENEFRIDLPRELDNAGRAAHFCVTEVIGSHPVWLVISEHAAYEGEPDWTQTLLVDHVINAVELMRAGRSTNHSLYVLLPASRSELQALQLVRCDAVVECLEPEDESALCWRIETPTFAFLDSAFDTQLGDETPQRVIWSRKGRDKAALSLPTVV